MGVPEKGSPGELLETLALGTLGIPSEKLIALFRQLLLGTGKGTRDWRTQLKQMYPLASEEQISKVSKALTLLSKARVPGKGERADVLHEVLTQLGIYHTEPKPKWLRELEQRQRRQIEGFPVSEADRLATPVSRKSAKRKFVPNKAERESREAAAVARQLEVMKQQERLAAARKAGIQKVLGPRKVPPAKGKLGPIVPGKNPPRGTPKGTPGTRPHGAAPWEVIARLLQRTGKKMPTNVGQSVAGAGGLMPLLLLLSGAHLGQKRLTSGAINPSEILGAVGAGGTGGGAPPPPPVIEGTARPHDAGGVGGVAGLIGPARSPGGITAPKDPSILGMIWKSPWGKAGVGALIGLLLTSVLKKMYAEPEEYRLGGEVALAGMPPPELAALQAMVPQQMSQVNMLAQSLMGQGAPQPIGNEIAL